MLMLTREKRKQLLRKDMNDMLTVVSMPMAATQSQSEQVSANTGLRDRRGLLL